MAFKFGGSPFGGNTQPFGSATSTPSLFGAQSSASLLGFGTPASSSSNLFGASTPGAFGAATPSSGGLFGASSGGLFGSSSTPSLFGGQSSGGNLFGSPSPSLFGSASTAGQSGGLFGFGANSSPSLFGAQSSAAAVQGGGLFGGGFGQQAPAPTSNGAVLATTDNKPVTHYTRWEDINAAGQASLLELEKKITETREESRRLQECERIRQGPHEDPGESEAALRHGLKGVTGSRISDEQSTAALNERVQDLLHDTEQAVRTFERAFTWREVAKGGQGQVIPAGVRDLINAPIVLPSHFLEKSIFAFKENIGQYHIVVAELERLLPLHSTSRHQKVDQGQGPIEMLPRTLRNNYEYMLQVAAKLGKLQDLVAGVKERFLENRHKIGDYRDPFREAERREQQSAWDVEQARSRGIPPAERLGEQTLLLTSGQAGAATPASTPSLFGQAALNFSNANFDSSSRQGASRKSKKK